MTRLCELSMSSALHALGAGQASATELVTACLERIHEREPSVQAWEFLDSEVALAQAAARERGDCTAPLAGIPFGVKDIMDVAGMPTRCGSPVFDGRWVRADAACVGRLRAAGAIPLGKTVTTELAYFAPGKTRNPHHLEHTPGGSSSGSAAAVADYMVPFALGSQTAASTTRPAAYCGVAAYVATPVTIDLDGVQGLSPTLDSLGFFARTIEDLQLLRAVFAAPESSREPSQRPIDRLLFYTGGELAELDHLMSELYVQLPRVLERKGWVVAETTLGHSSSFLADAHATVMAWEAARTLADLAPHRHELSSELNELIDRGAATSHRDYDMARRTAHTKRKHMEDLLSDEALLVAPAAPGPAPPGLHSTGSPACSRPWQVMGMPTVTVPIPTERGLPLGIQLLGPPGSDDDVLDTAVRLERTVTIQ